MPPPQLLISDICSRLNVDGLRGDIVVNRAAKALVAFEGRTEVKEADIERVISLCLNHRCALGKVTGCGELEDRGGWGRCCEDAGLDQPMSFYFCCC